MLFRLILVCCTVSHVWSDNVVTVFDGNAYQEALSDKLLGEPCKDHGDCGVAYSQCDKRSQANTQVCICRDGFKENNSSCVPLNFLCPFGSPLLDADRSPQSCKRRFDATDDSKDVKDSCPSGHFCLPGSPAFDNGRDAYGFCCPQPNITCPFGGGADSVQPAGKCAVHRISGTYSETCDLATHYCHHVTIGSYQLGGVCCPRACAAAAVQRDGRCYVQVATGDKCQISEQCPHTAKCENGTCQCRQGLVMTWRGCFEPLCPNPSGRTMATKDSSGNVIRCEKNSCPSDNYCHATNAFCCPLPVSRCASSRRSIQPAAVVTKDTQQQNTTSDGKAKQSEDSKEIRCDKQGSNSCKNGETCESWFAEWNYSKHNVDNIGHCCQKTLL